MARSRPLLYAALFLSLWFIGGLVRGDGPTGPAAPAGTRVKLETTDGKHIEGTIQDRLTVRTDYGDLTFALAKVKTIDFADRDGKREVVVETTDGTHLRGEPQFDQLAIDTSGKVERVSVGGVRELVVLHEVDHSFFGLLIGLLALSALEIILGIDNVIFLAIIAGKLPANEQPKARQIGLAAALGTRILLLFSLSWLLGLTRPVVTLPIAALAPDARDISWRDIILLAGGAFLIFKSVMEMHHKLDEARKPKPAEATVGGTPAAGGASGGPAAPAKRVGPSFAKVIVQIAIIDIVFSLDSVITAVGVVNNLYVMIAAMVVAMGVMLVSAGPIGRFVERHATVKMLALAFLILIGVILVAEGFGQHINKGYIYFAMAFAVVLEFVNMKLRPKGVAGLIVGDSESPESGDTETRRPGDTEAGRKT